MATDILGIIITPITELAKLLLVPLKKQIGYLVKYHNNVKDLKIKAEQLGQIRDCAKCATDEARVRGEGVSKEMEQWLEKADRTMCDVHELSASHIGEGKRENSEICCTNLKTRYVSSKQALKLIKVINELKDDERQIPVSRPPPPPSIEMMPTGDFEAFESTRVAMAQIIEALNHDDNRVIGVYGMGGVGKTSLIREVAKHAKVMSMFDEVVIATVSQNPVLKKIQREIAEGLGLRLVEETEHIRSLRLAGRLKQGSRVFLVLDDIWDAFELSQVGIVLSGKDKSNCKIAITTRNLDVCSEMYCNVNIRVDPLSQQDSWDFFRKVVGDKVESPELNTVAKEVARECGGLPIALVTLGRVLRNKETRIWDDALYELRQSRPVNIKGMHEKVLSCLMLSFNQAQNEESKLCYLYCSLFPEDYDVRVEDLVRYGVGEGLFYNVDTVDEARNRVHSIISNLKASCLLLNSNNEESVKMHDVFRDLAITIATSNDYSFMVKASSGLKDWPRKLRLEYVMRMSLIDNEFSNFSGPREYPELLVLLLQNNRTLRTISDDFFAGMRSLHVLDLSNIPNLVDLPSSLSCLTNLKSLCVENNNLKDGYVLGELNSLEILSLRKSSFARFPEQIKRLTNLRLLDLTDSQVGMLPAQVISSLCNLEELYMGGSYRDWEVKEPESEGRATLAEVFSLERLNTLHIGIGKYECLTEEISSCSTRLKKFHIHIGETFSWPTTHGTSMCFNVPDHFRVPEPFMDWVKRFLQKTSELSIVRWKDLSSFEQLLSHDFQSMKHLNIQQCGLQACFSAAILARFRDLQDLEIFSCSELENVFVFNNNDPQNNVLPRLTRIHIRDAPRLTALCRGIAPNVCFLSLKHVKVESCVQIKNLFPLAIARALNQLQYLEISNCGKMEAVISNGGHEIQEAVLPGEEKLSNTLTIFPQLKTLKLTHLKNIRSLTQPWFMVDFPALEHVTVLSCPCLNKLPLGPKTLQRVIEIKAERKWLEELEFEDDKTKIQLQKCFIDIKA